MPEPIGQRSRCARASLGQQQTEPEARHAHRAVGLARLGADDVGQRPGDAIDRLLVGPPAQLDQEDRGGTAVASVTGALVLERDGPVLASVELERPTRPLDGVGPVPWRGGAVKKGLDVLGCAIVLVMVGQDELLRAARPWLGRAGGGTGGCSGVEGFLHAPEV